MNPASADNLIKQLDLPCPTTRLKVVKLIAEKLSYDELYAAITHIVNFKTSRIIKLVRLNAPMIIQSQEFLVHQDILEALWKISDETYNHELEDAQKLDTAIRHELSLMIPPCQN